MEQLAQALPLADAIFRPAEALEFGRACVRNSAFQSDSALAAPRATRIVRENPCSRRVRGAPHPLEN